MATTRGQFSQLLAPGLQNILFDELGEHPEEYSQFMEVETSDSAYVEDQILAGLGLARTKLEGETISYDDPIQGGTKRYLHTTYALGWQITMEMLQDDRYDIMTKMPPKLMKSCRQTWEQLAANVLIAGFTTVITADGVSLFNTAHPLLGGGTYPNRLTTLTDMSVTSLQDVTIMYENTVDERGLKVMLSPDDLWFVPELQFVAGEILQSQFKPYTGNNEINTMQGRFNPHALHFPTSNTFWAVSSNDQNNVRFYWRAKPNTDTIDDFETKGVKHSIVFRISTGATDWRGWVAGNS